MLSLPDLMLPENAKALERLKESLAQRWTLMSAEFRDHEGLLILHAWSVPRERPLYIAVCGGIESEQEIDAIYGKLHGYAQADWRDPDDESLWDGFPPLLGLACKSMSYDARAKSVVAKVFQEPLEWFEWVYEWEGEKV